MMGFRVSFALGNLKRRTISDMDAAGARLTLNRVVVTMYLDGWLERTQLLGEAK